MFVWFRAKSQNHFSNMGEGKEEGVWGMKTSSLELLNFSGELSVTIDFEMLCYELRGLCSAVELGTRDRKVLDSIRDRCSGRIDFPRTNLV